MSSAHQTSNSKVNSTASSSHGGTFHLEKLGNPAEREALKAADDADHSQQKSSHKAAENVAETLHLFGRFRRRFRKPLAEFLGTMILIILGDGVSAQTILSGKTQGSPITIGVGWGLAVMFGVYACFGVSGGHINPAVTIALAVFGRMSWVDVPEYVIAQILGAFVGSGLVYADYLEAFNAFDGGVRSITGPTATASVFCTYPQPFMSWVGAFFDQVFESAILMAMIFMITDVRNHGKTALVPVVVGAGVCSIGISYGWETAFAINPARDFGPRLMSAAVGYPNVFTFFHYYCLVPIFAPIIGTITGAFVYTVLIDSGSKENDLWGTPIKLRERRASLLGAAP